MKRAGRVVPGLARAAARVRPAESAERVESETPTPEPAEVRPNPVLQAVKGAGRVVPGLARVATSRVRPARPAERVESETPASKTAEQRHDPLRMLLRKALSGAGRAARAARRRGRPPFRAHAWFGKRRRSIDGHGDKGKSPRKREGRDRRTRRLPMALAALALIAATVPAFALADGPWSGDAWRLDEIGYLPPEPVPGRSCTSRRSPAPAPWPW